MIHQLPKLPYELNALEPHINRQTLEFHYGKHHQAYINNLNNLIKNTKYENSTLEEIIKTSEGGIFNNGAQVWNHTFYFTSFSKNGGNEPTGILADVIKRDFGSFAVFKEKFSQAAATLFGSGWAWLVVTPEKKLEILQESNAGNPLRKNLQPLLTCDVWEHAYYLDYQNRRPDYINSFWNVVDWNIIEERFRY